MKDFVPKPGRLMDQVVEVMRFYHYAYSTEKTYVFWILQYIRFNDRRHPLKLLVGSDNTFDQRPIKEMF